MIEQGAGVPNGKIQITWIGGTHDFCLATIGAQLEVEARCGVGLAAVLKRLQERAWGVYDAVWPIRMGLIGGGMGATEAEDLCKRHVYPPNPLAASVLMSIDIISAAIVGVVGDEVGKAPADRAKEGGGHSSTPRADSSDPQSTASAARSTSRRGKSTK